MINIQKTENNILTLSVDSKDASANLIDESFLTHFETLVEEITRDEGTLGVIITSSRKEFLLGADLEMFKSKSSPSEIYQLSRKLQKVLRKLETWGKPVVAAINGSALGGGLELALSCHHRIAVNHKSIRLGLPEVKIGLMPGGGGTQRLIRLIGIEKSLPLLLNGNHLSPLKAKEIGIIDALADNKEELLEKAKAFIEQNPEVSQKWDKSLLMLDPHAPNSPKGYQFFSIASAMVDRDYLSFGTGPQKILSSVYEGSLVPIEQACQIEANYFAELFQEKSSQAMMQTLFYGVQKCKKKGDKLTDQAQSIKTIGIIGAGIMGRGIAQIAAQLGIDVLLKDQDLTTAEMGRNTISKSLDKDISRQRIEPSAKKDIIEKIKSVDKFEDFLGCDLIIEAAPENLALKKSLFKELEEVIAPDTILATNTSSLPLSITTEGMKNPERVIGLHFFSPVPRMSLVEIIKAKKTNQKTLIRSLKFIKDLGKVPIIVRDGLGFFTTRVFMKYITEAILALTEGCSPALIENAGRSLGFPMGPLEVGDEVSLNLIKNLLEEKARLEKVDAFSDLSEKKTQEVVTRFITKFERLGKKNRKGFYDYPTEGPKRISRQTYQEAEVTINNPSDVGTFECLKDRLFYIQIIETMKCYEEGILNTAHEGDVASIMGWGFPSHTGGVVSACHREGNQALLDKLSTLQEKWGDRFSAPKILKTLINKNYDSLHEAREILSSPLLEE